MAKTNKLNVYFPINNLNPQGWISEFITPVLQKTFPQRSDVANLFYDKEFSPDLRKELIKRLTLDEFADFILTRQQVQDDKFTFLNGNFLDMLEIDASMKDSTLTDIELRTYTQFMAQIKPFQSAFLQPYIKLQYGYRNNAKEKFTYIDFPFTQFYNLDFILMNPQARSEGSGITSVVTNNKFNQGTHVNSDIEIGFDFGNLKVLTQEILGNGIPVEKGQSPFPYGFSFTKVVANLDLSKEILRLEYGRKVGNGFDTVVADQSLKSIIERKEKKVYLLNKTGHSFTFDEKGYVSLKVNYMNFHDAAIFSENNISVPGAGPANAQSLSITKEYGNILSGYRKLKKNVFSLETDLKDVQTESQARSVDKINSQQKDMRIKDITAKLAQSNKNINLLKRSLKPGLTTVLLDKIKDQGQLFGVNFNTIKEKSAFKLTTNIFLVKPSNGDFQTIFEFPAEYKIDELKNSPKIKELVKMNSSSAEDLLTRVFSRIFNAPYDEKQINTNKTYGQIMFFPLKALISAAYSFLEPKEQDNIPNLLFGNVLMKIGDNVCSINIGDLLIESETFQKWYYRNFFKKDMLDYSFGAFITDIITDLVPEATHRNRVGFDDKAPMTSVKETQFYLKDKIPDQLKQDLYWKGDRDDMKLLSYFLTKTPSDNPKPLIYYTQMNNQTSQITSPSFSNLGVSEFNFNEIQDSAKGIPHLKIGADGGVFTHVDFQALDLPRMRSSISFGSLANSQSRYFLFYYQLSIDMLGNNLFAYDGVVCVPSNPLGIDSEENDPGIAGYYKLTSTTDKLDLNNNYTTTAQATWTFSPKNDDREKQKIASMPVADRSISDSISEKVNDPRSYLTELLSNDANAIIVSQLQNVNVPEDKTENVAKKDNNKKAAPAKNVDLVENFK